MRLVTYMATIILILNSKLTTCGLNVQFEIDNCIRVYNMYTNNAQFQRGLKIRKYVQLKHPYAHQRTHARTHEHSHTNTNIHKNM